MHKLFRRIILGLVALGPFSLFAQQPAPAATGLVSGRLSVTGTGAAVFPGSVRVLGSALGAAVGPDGRFTIREVPVGIVRLEARAIGYGVRIVSEVVVSAGKPAEVMIELSPIPLALQSITVRPTYFPTLPPPSRVVSTQTLTAEEIRRTPGAQEDVLNVLSALPGVNGSTGPGRNDIVVRGGAAFENLFVIDNIELPNINHFGVQGSSAGAVALVGVSLVRDVSVSAGGFGVRDGDKVSSVTRLELREGSRDQRSTELNLSATGVSAISEGPLGGKGTYLASVRRSYLDFLFSAIGLAIVPSYTDVTLKTVFRPTERDRISTLFIGAVDRFAFTNDSADQRFDNSRFSAPTQDQVVAGVSWQRTLPKGLWTTTLGQTWARYRTTQQDTGTATTPPQIIFQTLSTEAETSLRTDVSWQWKDAVQLESGVQAKLQAPLTYAATLGGDRRTTQTGVPAPLSVDTSITTSRAAAYVQATTTLSDKLRATTGLRVDGYQYGRTAVRVAPRASITWAIDDRSSLSLAGGRYWQAPPTIWLVGDPNNRNTLTPFYADQVVLGWQRLLRDDLKVQVETYTKRYGDYPARVFRPQAALQPGGFSDVTTDIPFGLEPLVSTGSGRVSGVEFLVQKRLSDIPVYAVFALGLSQGRFKGLDGLARRGTYDTPVTSSALLGWRPSSKWEVASRIRGSSGIPTTPYVASGPAAGTLDFTQYNSGERVPAFIQVDVRVDRRWQPRGKQLIGYIDLQNVLGRQQSTRLQWNPRTQRAELDDGLSSLIPSIGISWQF
ncbi:MAG: TonB-dependent receptor [Gemmatimonadaceae bacterium]|nr:TonB-dependent receptor [Gemmatimonadaceae bacterium]